MPGVPGCFAHTFARSHPNFDVIIARDDRAEFTSGANAVSETNVNDARRSEQKELTTINPQNTPGLF